VPNSAGATDFSIVGSSPEALVTVADGRARDASDRRYAVARAERGRRPAAGKRSCWRTKKERAEHLMLVDLGRNDPRPGSARRALFASRTTATSSAIATSCTWCPRSRACSVRAAPALDAVTACFPRPARWSGAPKVRAMELIEEVEKTRRGVYGGVLGYLDFAGNADFRDRNSHRADAQWHRIRPGGRRGWWPTPMVPTSTPRRPTRRERLLNAIAAAETLTAPDAPRNG